MSFLPPKTSLLEKGFTQKHFTGMSFLHSKTSLLEKGFTQKQAF